MEELEYFTNVLNELNKTRARETYSMSHYISTV